MGIKALGQNYIYRSSSCSVYSNCSYNINHNSTTFIGYNPFVMVFAYAKTM